MSQKKDNRYLHLDESKGHPSALTIAVELFLKLQLLHFMVYTAFTIYMWSRRCGLWFVCGGNREQFTAHAHTVGGTHLEAEIGQGTC